MGTQGADLPRGEASGGQPAHTRVSGSSLQDADSECLGSEPPSSRPPPPPRHTSGQRKDTCCYSVPEVCGPTLLIHPVAQDPPKSDPSGERPGDGQSGQRQGRGRVPQSQLSGASVWAPVPRWCWGAPQQGGLAGLE